MDLTTDCYVADGMLNVYTIQIEVKFLHTSKLYSNFIVQCHYIQDKLLVSMDGFNQKECNKQSDHTTPTFACHMELTVHISHAVDDM